MTIKEETVATAARMARPPVPRFRSVVPVVSPLAAVLWLWRREWLLAGLGVLGFVLAAATTGVAAVNGSWFMEPEGRLLEAVKFDVAIGIYVLTLALVLPLAPFSRKRRRHWIGWMVGLTVFGYLVETVQAWRGLDPRFSAAGGPVAQVLGGVFFLSALGIMVLFVILMVLFFRGDAVPDHAPLRLSLRYAAAGALLAFGAGIVMSVVSGRTVGDGDLMPLHAGGFHALQAVPLIALLLGPQGAAPPGRATVWVHLAGGGWLVLCLGLAGQALGGWPPREPTWFLALTLVGGLGWAAALVHSARIRARQPNRA